MHVTFFMHSTLSAFRYVIFPPFPFLAFLPFLYVPSIIFFFKFYYLLLSQNLNLLCRVTQPLFLFCTSRKGLLASYYGLFFFSTASSFDVFTPPVVFFWKLLFPSNSRVFHLLEVLRGTHLIF